MTRPRRRLWDYESPRGITAGEAAHLLGISESTFKTILPDLERAGFPKQDSLTGRRDKKAIDLWLDRRAGIASPLAVDQGDDGDLGARLDQWVKSGGVTS